MVTHDFHCPIPPSTVRVSVILGGDNFTVDLRSDKIATTIQAFEDHCDAGQMSADRCMAVAVEAADDGDAHLVTVAALWLWLFQPVDGEITPNVSPRWPPATAAPYLRRRYARRPVHGRTGFTPCRDGLLSLRHIVPRNGIDGGAGGEACYRLHFEPRQKNPHCRVRVARVGIGSRVQ
jgi:hypothetical protein